METTPLPEVRSVLIVKADRLCAEALAQLTRSTFSRAQVRIATSVAEATRALAISPVDLLLTGIGPSLKGDVLELLASCDDPLRRTLVITTNRERHQLTVLRRLPIHGAFDSASGTSVQLIAALRLVATGRRCWSETFLTLLRDAPTETPSIFQTLTAAEQLLLSILGDGSDDLEAAHELGLSPTTVATVRRNLHRKLGVQHRGQLIRFAAQNGFVRFTSTGVVRPGFVLLAAVYHPKKRKPVELAAA